MTARCPTTYVISGTKSFRLGSRKVLGLYGANLQNPGKDIIDIYCAPAGRVIVQADQSGAEALIVANDTKPGNYSALFATGIKPHTFLAMHIFAQHRPDWFEGLPLKRESYLDAAPADLAALEGWGEIKKRIQDAPNSATEYYIGKRTAHGKAYRMGPRTYQLTLLRDSDGKVVITHAQAKYFLSVYDALFPDVLEWQEWIEFTARRDGVLYNLFGDPRQCCQPLTDAYIRELISWRPQSTVGVLTHEAFIKAQEHIETFGLDAWHLCSNKHDSLAIECPESDAPLAGKLLRDLLRAPVFVGRNGRPYSMKSEVKAGRRWVDFDEHDEDTFDGLKKLDL